MELGAVKGPQRRMSASWPSSPKEEWTPVTFKVKPSPASAFINLPQSSMSLNASTATLFWAGNLTRVRVYGEVQSELCRKLRKNVKDLQGGDYDDMLLKDHHNLVTADNVRRVRKGLAMQYSWLTGNEVHESMTSPGGAEPYHDDGPHTAIIAFQDATLHNLFQGHGVGNANVAQNINKVFGKYMEDLLTYPRESFDPKNSTLESNRVTWYADTVHFPGAKDPGFSTSGVHWASFSELQRFLHDYADFETMESSRSDDAVLMDGFRGMVEIMSHLLIPVKRNGRWRITVAASVPRGTILGLVPGLLHYVAMNERSPTSPPSHWIDMVNSVFFEPTPSPFTSIFEENGDSLENVRMAHEIVGHADSGLGPSYRVYAVAFKDIQALELLST